MRGLLPHGCAETKRPPPGLGPPAPRGRPLGSRRAEPGGTVSAWLPESLHDQLIDLANREEQSISATIRALLVLRLR